MSVTTRNQGTAQAIARKLMTGWDVADLENLMTEHISADEDRELLCQIEPKYDAMEKESSKIYGDLHKQLKRKTEKASLGRYAEIQMEMSVPHRQAGFQLGFAAALQLLGEHKCKAVLAEQNKSPFEVAQEAVREAFGSQIGPLHSMIQNSLARSFADKIRRAVNPQIDQLEKQHEDLRKKADSEGQHRLAVEFDDVWSGRAVVWEDAAFVLGLAFAQHMNGGKS